MAWRLWDTDPTEKARIKPAPQHVRASRAFRLRESARLRKRAENGSEQIPATEQKETH